MHTVQFTEMGLSIDWNALAQLVFAALAAYFGGRHGSSQPPPPPPPPAQ